MNTDKPIVGTNYHLMTPEETAKLIDDANDKKGPTFEQRWLKSRWFKWLGKLVEVLPPDFNMPKAQSCPECNAYSRRLNKTETGAFYCCRTHSKFLILSPSRLKEPSNVT